MRAYIVYKVTLAVAQGFYSKVLPWIFLIVFAYLCARLQTRINFNMTETAIEHQPPSMPQTLFLTW